MNLIGFLGLVNQQMDKVLVSHFFSLEVFGYYNLATMITNGFTMLFSPVNLTYFPRLSVLFAQKDETGLRHEYHQACQLVSVAILPAVTTGVLFSNKIILLWTGSQEIADKTAPIAALLLIGTAFKALSIIPFAAQFAVGWTKLALFCNIISLPFIILMFFLLNSWFGILGVASIWFIYNLLVLLITMPLMHRKMFKEEFGNWLKLDTIFPLAVCFLCFGILMLLERSGIYLRNSIPALLCFAIVIQSSVALIVPFTRKKIFQSVNYFVNTFTKNI
jgi:O-antigen/teichoic acid export membrane protein